MAYIDAFVIPIPKKNLPAYLLHAASRPWNSKELAFEYRDARATTRLPFALPQDGPLQARRNRHLLLIVYQNKAHRKRVTAKVMKDPRIAAMCDPKNMPFDMRRMACGGFKITVSA